MSNLRIIPQELQEFLEAGGGEVVFETRDADGIIITFQDQVWAVIEESPKGLFIGAPFQDRAAAYFFLRHFERLQIQERARDRSVGTFRRNRAIRDRMGA